MFNRRLGDAQKVKDYAAQHGKPELAEDYAHLKEIIEQVFKVRNIQKEIQSLSKTLKNGRLAGALDQAAR